MEKFKKSSYLIPVLVIVFVAVIVPGFIQDRDAKLVLWGAVFGAGLMILYFGLLFALRK